MQRAAQVDTQDQAGFTPLHSAAIAGYVETIRLLLEHGYNLHAKDKLGVFPSLQGQAPSPISPR